MAAHPTFCFDHVLPPPLQPTTHDSIVINLSLLRDKAQQLQSLATMAAPVNMDNFAALLQEIIVIASNLMYTCQNDSNQTNVDNTTHENVIEFDQLNAMFEWSGDTYGGGVENSSLGSVTCNARNDDGDREKRKEVERDRRKGTGSRSPKNYDIVEMDAADLLAKYTHYCPVCGKGFKRDANLRMHMRAHGDEYKSNAALANPGGLNGCSSMKLARKYSCPQDGCRWNRKHAKFQPLKSMICMKNHYKRSHCPKMYTCKRCHQKQFSVLSDLRTHEKHCGDVKWRCSCGTTFSRKDKLMGHVGLFLGHTPVVDTSYVVESRQKK